LKLNNIPCILNHHLKNSQVIQFDTFFKITNNQSIDDLNDSLNDLNEKLLNETTKAQLEQEFIDKVNETINISLKVNLSALSDKIEILIDALSGDPCQLNHVLNIIIQLAILIILLVNIFAKMAIVKIKHNVLF
jgi:hypothetical protein